MGAKRSAESLRAEKAYKAAPDNAKPGAAELARRFRLTESAIRKSAWFSPASKTGTAK